VCDVSKSPKATAGVPYGLSMRRMADSTPAIHQT
jgi:hypothetical protein